MQAALVEPILSGLLRASFQAALLVPLVLAIQRLAGPRLSPAVRHALWWLVLIRLALPWTPSSPVSVFHLVTPNLAPRIQATFSVPPQPAVASTPTPAFEESPALTPPPLTGSASMSEVAPPDSRTLPAPPSGITEPVHGPALPPHATVTPRQTARPPSPGFPAGTGSVRLESGWARSLTAVWICIAVGLLLRLAVRNLRFADHLHATARPVAPDAARLLDAARHDLRIRIHVAACETPLVLSPAICGLLRPRILLPAGFADTCPPSQLRHVFLHELAHLRRGDLIANALASVLQSIHWFNPLVWLAFHRLRLDREIAADALALSVAGESDARAYGQTIVHVLERWMRAGAQPALVGILENPRDLQQRIRAITRYRPLNHRFPVGPLFVAGLAVVSLTDARPAPRPDSAPDLETLLHLEFVGLHALRQHPELPAVRRLLDLPESGPLGDAFATRLARQLGDKLGIDTTPGTLAASAWTTLIRDLLDAESLFDVPAGPATSTGWTLAARLNAETSRRVSHAVARLRPLPGTGDRPSLESAGDWTVIHRGSSAPASILERLRRLGDKRLIPGPELVRANADLRRLALVLGWPSVPAAPLTEWPAVEWSLRARQGRLLTGATLRFQRAFDLELTPWQIPTNLLHDPMVSFTAMQGADRWLERRALPPMDPPAAWPRQAFAWSLAGAPWQRYFAGPAAAPDRLLHRLVEAGPTRLLGLLGWPDQPVRLEPDASGQRIRLHGPPYFRPFAESTATGDQPMVFAGLFPPPATGAPAPAGLLAQVSGRTNLVLYHWETTGTELAAPGGDGSRKVGRLPQLREMAQFERFLRHGASGGGATGPHGEILIPGSAWIDAATPHLGDTVTELTRTGPAELTLTRHSQLGLDAEELLRVLAWIEPSPTPGAGVNVASTGGKPARNGIPERWPPMKFTPVVIDADTRAPIPDFELLIGIPRPDDPGSDTLHWEPATDRHSFAGGSLHIDWVEYWNGIRFAVFTKDGRVAETPVHTRGGPVRHVFEVRHREGLRGQILTAEGQPAPGATLVVPDGAFARNTAQNPSLMFPTPDNSLPIKTDAQGRFTLGPFLAGSRILAVHPHHGFAELRADALTSPATIRLQPFGRIEGVAWVGPRPAARARIEIVGLPLGVLEAMDVPANPNSNLITTSDAEGRFVLDPVPPGTRILYYAIEPQPPRPDDIALLGKLGITPGSLFDRAASRPPPPRQSGFLAQVIVAPGQTAWVQRGNPGTAVSGKVLHPDPLRGPQLGELQGQIHGPTWTDLKRGLPFASDLERRRWLTSPQHRDAAIPPRSWSFTIAKDGTFRVEDLAAGTYHLMIFGGMDVSEPRLAVHRTFKIAAATGGTDPTPLDLGDLKARLSTRTTTSTTPTPAARP